MTSKPDTIVGIIQARMGSSRLPGKVLMPLCGKPVLWHIVQRLARTPSVSQVVVATSEQPENQPIVELCRQEGIPYFVGSETDVLDRFYKGAMEAKATTVIRVTADCPLVDPGLVESVIEKFQAEGYDHCAVACGAGVANQGFQGRFPDGMDAEVFKFSVLQEAWEEAKAQLQREHVTPFIWQQPQRYKLGHVVSPVDYSDWRLTLDHKEDFDFISKIYEALYPTNPHFSLADVIQLVNTRLSQERNNAVHIGHEGYKEFWHGNAE